MPLSSRFLLSAIAVAVAALSLAGSGLSNSAAAKDKGQQYEEHYETVPADIDPSGGPEPQAEHDPDPAPIAPPHARSRYEGARPERAVEEPPRETKRKQQSGEAPDTNPRPASGKQPEPRDEQQDARERETRRSNHAVREPVKPRAEPKAEAKPAEPAGPPHEERDYRDGDDITDTAYFFDALREGGSWYEHPRLGAVWQPDVDARWRPYTLGRWAYSDDYGWAWVSDEPFGWAVYHYGRWTFDEDHGWLWIPGREWAPAWVVWRYSDEAIGWAPLPVESRIEAGRVFTNPELFESPRYQRMWVFVGSHHFGRSDQRKYLRSASWNSELMAGSHPRITHEHVDNRNVNRGIAPEDIERLAGRPVRKARVAPSDDPRVRGHSRFEMRDELKEDEVRLFRPHRDDADKIAREAVRPGLNPPPKVRKSQPPRTPKEPVADEVMKKSPAKTTASKEVEPDADNRVPKEKYEKVDETAVPGDAAKHGNAGSGAARTQTTRAKQASPDEATDATIEEPLPSDPPAKKSGAAKSGAASAAVGDAPGPVEKLPAGKAAAGKGKTGAAAATSGEPPAGTGDASPAAPAKRRWDGNGPSGAPAVGPTGAQGAGVN
jgi:hypothetical protein